MSADDVQTVLEPILNAHGIEFRDVIPQLHEDSKHPVIKWHNNGEDIYVSPEFRALTPEEMQFGALWTLLPKPEIKSRFGALKEFNAPMGLLLLAILIATIPIPGPEQLALGVALLIFVTIGQFSRSRKKDQQWANHLDNVVAITGDAISARTYLEKAYGSLRPNSVWNTDLRLTEHPILKYNRQGKDQRLKAILMSDLAHPTHAAEKLRDKNLDQS